MCLANDYILKIKSIISDISKDKDKLIKELTKYNYMQEDILHKIESSNFNAATGYYYSKLLKDVRTERRRIKNELEKLFSLYQSTTLYLEKLNSVNQTIENKEKKHSAPIYQPRVLKII
jgi:hypothetical protein